MEGVREERMEGGYNGMWLHSATINVCVDTSTCEALLVVIKQYIRTLSASIPARMTGSRTTCEVLLDANISGS